jgi:YidC/Oxa1 family membrane protein insertase
MGLTTDKILQISNYLSFQGVQLPPATSAYRELLLSSYLHDHVGSWPKNIMDMGILDINYNFFGLNLAEQPSLSHINWLILIPIISGATAFLSMWISQKASNMPAPQGSAKTTAYLMPLLSVYFGFIMPGLLGLYWIAQNVFSMVQDYFLSKYYNKVFAKADAERAALEARRKAAEEAMKEELRQRRAASIEEKKQKRKPGQTVYKLQKRPNPKAKAAEEE